MITNLDNLFDMNLFRLMKETLMSKVFRKVYYGELLGRDLPHPFEISAHRYPYPDPTLTQIRK